ncbi:MAG TPA: penicillin-binding protein 1C, partial [Deltaproteobacteria bacterium]|nr:penicillin-binding protein 1C [Deltaproteobacteria bacterium]
NNAANVVSTLDWRLQSFTAEILRQHLLSVHRQNVKDGAVLVVENKTGDVLAYIGSSGDLSSARYVNGIHAKRQAGSTLKPFLYAAAFEKKLLTAASMIDDSPLDISVVTGIYRPRNYDSQFQGLVNARTALASSLNVPAVKILQLVGVEPFLQKLKHIGFDGLDESDDFYGPSIALGSADVSLWELVNAYRTLANEGIWSEMRLTFDMETKPSYRREFSKEASFIISDILSDREARSNTFGLESPLSTRFWTAVKTGTSKDMRDNWCIGYSSKYTVGVWVGNFSGEPMWNVSGITGAAPVWVEIIDWLHRSDPDQPKKPATGMLSKKNLSERAEWFIKGTEPDTISRTGISPHVSQHIAYPVTGTIIALDPDIPYEQQKVFFESQPIDNNNSHRWVLDGEDMSYSWTHVGWTPVAGKHTLLLIGQENKVVGSVNFEVRGNTEQLTEKLPY